MKQEQRIAIAVLVSLIAFMAINYYETQRIQKWREQHPEEVVQETGEALSDAPGDNADANDATPGLATGNATGNGAENTTGNADTADQPATAGGQTPAVSAFVPEEQLAQEEYIQVLKLPDRTIRISNRGAILTGVQLEDRFLSVKKKNKAELLARFPNVNMPGFLGVGLDDEDLAREFNKGVYVPGEQLPNPLAVDQNTSFSFLRVAPDGLALRKTFFIYPRSGGIQVEYELENRSDKAMKLRGVNIVGGNTFGLSERHFLDSNTTVYQGRAHFGPLVSFGASTDKEAFDKKQDREEFSFSGEIRWGAIDTPYFIAALGAPRGEVSSRTVLFLKEDRRAYIFWPLGTITIAPGDMELRAVRCFVGAKDFDELSALGGGLHNSLDFGWFSFFATPLFIGLRFLHTYVGNWGLAIIALTVIVRSLLLVFTIPSMKGMQKMQEVAPKIEKIRKEIKDPQQQNAEIMALYRREGVNPLQSCLPMLLQIPIFIALYNVLFVAIELRHAPFVLWLTDLSAPDPFKILPILMGVTMLVQQLVTPQAAGMDKMQAQLMKWMMPLFLVGISWSFPSGLVLYWTTSNIFTVGQQLVLMELGVINKPAPPKPANNTSESKRAKRRRKKNEQQNSD